MKEVSVTLLSNDPVVGTKGVEESVLEWVVDTRGSTGRLRPPPESPVVDGVDSNPDRNSLQTSLRRRRRPAPRPVRPWCRTSTPTHSTRLYGPVVVPPIQPSLQTEASHVRTEGLFPAPLVTQEGLRHGVRVTTVGSDFGARSHPGGRRGTG